jgi:hypothetical protein
MEIIAINNIADEPFIKGTYVFTSSSYSYNVPIKILVSHVTRGLDIMSIPESLVLNYVLR